MSTPIIHAATIQGSEEWLKLRLGKVTASELGRLLTPVGMKISKGEKWDNYMLEKVSEKWRGKLNPDTGRSRSMDQGTMREDEAIPYYSLLTDTEVTRVGFVETADGRFGCSPDGLIGEDYGLEIKCPLNPAIHLRYLFDGELPKDYAAQVHGSMYATGRSSWVFMSYHPSFPKFILRVERDEAICARIAEALEKFNGEMDAMLARLKELDEI